MSNIYSTQFGTTSTTIQNLFKKGWRTSKSGAVHILRDETGKEVLTAYTWLSLLEKTEKLMR